MANRDILGVFLFMLIQLCSVFNPIKFLQKKIQMSIQWQNKLWKCIRIVGSIERPVTGSFATFYDPMGIFWHYFINGK